MPEDDQDREDETWLAELQRALDQAAADPEPAANGPALGPVLATAYTRAAREAREAREGAGPEDSTQDGSVPAPTEDLGRIEAAIEALQASVEALTARVEAAEAARGAQPAPPIEGEWSLSVDQDQFDEVVGNAVRLAVDRSPVGSTDSARIEAEVRSLEETVHTLAERIAELNVSALARDRLEKDVHVRQLAEAAEEVRQQLETAAGAQQGFRDGVERLLERAAEGHGTEVAWTDVLLLAHELRSRVDDLDGQQRRTLRELAEWQLSVDEQLAEMRQAMLNELRRLVGEARQ